MSVVEQVPLSTNGRPTLVPAQPPKQRWRVAIVVAVAAFLVIALAMVVSGFMKPRIAYVTTQVVRKDLVQSVTASGSVNPQDTILIGTQVSGTVVEQDADFNTVVRKGQILSRLDPTSFQAQLDSARSAESEARSAAAANLAIANSARANVEMTRENIAAAREALASAQAQISKAKAALYLASVTVRRDRSLLNQGYIAQAQFDADTANATAAQSAQDSALIAVSQARAQLQSQIAAQIASSAQAQSAAANAVASGQAVGVQSAAVAQARYNFDNAVIRSQVDGTVIARNITVGQTVAASFQTPTLFTIGRDLTKMEVDVSVGEPDIGGVRVRDPVDFTVLAYPNRIFHGTVYQVRKNPTMVNNVVTYDTIVYVQNNDGALYPGMTANAAIHIATAKRALVVPIAALQWAPPDSRRSGSAQNGTSAQSTWGMTDAALTRTVVAGRSGRLYVMRSGQLARVPVRVALVSGTEAAITPVGATLNAGDTIVTSDSTTQMASQQSSTSSSSLTTRVPSVPSRPGGSQ